MDKLSKNKKRIYDKILDEKDMVFFKPEPTESSFLNELEVVYDIGEGDVVLKQKDSKKSLSIKSLLPKCARLKIEQNDWGCDWMTNTVSIGKIWNEWDLLACLHEIGHAWDFYEKYGKNFKIKKREALKWDREKDVSYKSECERNAWVWALKKFRELKKDGYVDKNFSNQMMMEEAKVRLYGYARDFKDVSAHNKFLRKEL